MAKLIDCLEDISYEIYCGSIEDQEFTGLAYDSRKANADTVFLCMKGSVVDSHRFIQDVIEKGVRVIFVEETREELPIDLAAIGENVAIVHVESTRVLLSYLSQAYFHYPAREMTVIALTGTKGKTTTAHMLREILESAGMPTGLIGTNGVAYRGRHIETKNTTPESYELQGYLRAMADAGCECVVMEASSQGFKLSRTAGMRFDYGVFTNIEPDHIGPNEHADFAEYMYYKTHIFKQSKVGLVNRDADYSDEFIAGAPCRIYTYGIDSSADFMAEGIDYLNSGDFVGMEFDVIGKTDLSIKLSMPGRYNIYNALAAISVASLMGLRKRSICDALRHIRVNGRVELAYKNADFSVIVDYAHNAMAMENLISTLREYRPKRLVLVFGCGGNRAKDRRFGMGKVAGEMADLSILTADNSRFEKTEDIIADIKSTLVPTGGAYVEVPDRREAIEYALSHALKGDMIAVIGKGHEDYNEVNGVRTHFLDREVVVESARKLALL